MSAAPDSQKKHIRLKSKAIRHIRGLYEIPVYAREPGVYFLCLGDEVVYVGQSTNPAGRVAEHAANPRKVFDRVYVLPVAAEDLSNVEGAFIKYLKPAQQYGPRSTKMSLPRMTKTVFEAIARHLPFSRRAELRKVDQESA